MKILSIVKIVVAIAVLVGVTAFFLNKNKTTQTAKIEAAQVSLTPSVQVATVQRQTLQGTTEFIGKTEFLKEVLMTATTQGVVKEVYFKLNGFVTEGASLLKVDTDLSNAALDIAPFAIVAQALVQANTGKGEYAGDRRRGAEYDFAGLRDCRHPGKREGGGAAGAGSQDLTARKSDFGRLHEESPFGVV